MRNAPNLRVINGSLPPEKIWTEAEVLRLCQLNVKALPFVKNKKDAEPQWLPESFWNVRPTGRGARDYSKGVEYAVAAMDAMRRDGAAPLGQIFVDMIRAGIKAKRYDAVMSGFLYELGKLLAIELKLRD